jgi:predicted PurR-regulated permease PerM
MDQNRQPLSSLTIQTLAIVAVIAAVGAILALLWYALDLLLLLFCGFLLSIVNRLVSRYLQRYLNIPQNWSIGLVLFASLVLFALFLQIAIPFVFDQSITIVQNLGDAVQTGMDQVKKLEYGEDFIRTFRDSLDKFANLATVGNLRNLFSNAFDYTFRILLVIATGLYFSINPELYVSGFLKLLPSGAQPRIRDLLANMRSMLEWWLLGRLLSMIMVGLVASIGLWAIGIPYPVPLGVVAAILELIPYLGPPLAMIPAALLGITISPFHSLYVVILFAIIQFLEGFLITPVIQEKALALPPALIIATQVLMGLVAGGLGVLVATPLLGVIVLSIQMLYVQDVLEEDVELIGHQS